MSERGRGEVGAILVGAGRGERMGTPKFLLHAGERPLLAYCAEVFESCPVIDVICAVVPAGSEPHAWDLVRTERWQKVRHVCAGGEERQASVRAGLELLGDCEWVVVHDVARPLVTQELIVQGLAAARTSGAAVAAVPVRDTVKMMGAGGYVRNTLDRRQLWAAQTPQVFRASLLREAHVAGRDVAASDDAMLVEALGRPVRVYEGSHENVKVTVPADVPLIECLLRMREAAGSRQLAEEMMKETGLTRVLPRVGIGYDLHRLRPGRRMVLGGTVVEHPGGLGLDGHSDADALTHAIIDALLGAAGLPDIGQQFPPGDPQYSGISSIELLRRTRDLVVGDGWSVGNVDATVIAEAPRLGPYLPAMREALADVLGVPSGAVGLKAKTNEQMDGLGRGEAIAAWAVAVIWNENS